MSDAFIVLSAVARRIICDSLCTSVTVSARYASTPHRVGFFVFSPQERHTSSRCRRRRSHGVCRHFVFSPQERHLRFLPTVCQHFVFSPQVVLVHTEFANISFPLFVFSPQEQRHLVVFVRTEFANISRRMFRSKYFSLGTRMSFIVLSVAARINCDSNRRTINVTLQRV